jgi:outer membrane protein assembly factor BamB
MQRPFLRLSSLLFLSLLLVPLASGQGPRRSADTQARSDWPNWRGPTRDGISTETGLPTTWSMKGTNLAWKAPYGGRSGPIVLGDRLFIQNAAGKDDTLQERVMCFNADTGKLLWEHRFNMYLSDVPKHRVGWASPVGDPTTGNIYALGGGGSLLALSNDGKVLWQRSLTEEFGLWTTHGGRTVSPIIEGDLVIMSGPTEGWGDQAPRRHRFMAFDKKTGETVWVSSPGGRPYDTTYPPPIAAEINGTRLIITGAGDGAVHAMKAQTGEPVWRFEMAKRGINTGVVVKGNLAIVSHSEENLDTSEMGLLAAIDATAKGNIVKEQAKWIIKGFQGGFSSPILDGDRLYQIDNGANLFAFDVNTGKQLWIHNLGTIQKASPVFADGKLYVGTENGKFFILKPGAEKCEVISEVELGDGPEGHEQIIASVAISRGRIFLVSDIALYCIGKKSNYAAPPAQPEPAVAAGAQPAWVQVVPTELELKPGQTVRFRARLFDDRGRFIREEQQPTWSLDQVKGTISADGSFTVAADQTVQAGAVKATVGQISGVARLRVFPALPWSEDFQAIAANAVPRSWINTDGKYAVREMDGSNVLVKNPNPPIFKRGRAFIGASNMSNYTVEAEIRAQERRRQMGDAGVVAQRYSLVLFGNHQRLSIESWQPEIARSVHVPFAWKADTWYHMKLEVQNLPGGKTRARGKAWVKGEPEPTAWTIEKIDPLGNPQGSPGIYADASFEIYFDNVKVTSNK